MKRRIRLDCGGGRIDRVQCPNPSCDETLVIPDNDERRGHLKVEIVCPKCGESAILMIMRNRR